ncbi:MAG: GNAT family N-acetyltransferase [bacterium]|nr:MAG: GNAT family N-acetyltransferase [bacterium]
MNQPDEQIRNYTEGDETAIVRLFNDVFAAERTVERWAWQFQDHVQGAGWITLAEAGDEIVGQYCMMRNHLNFMGREICAGQSCDTMVRSDQRGKRWFVRLASANYEYAAGTGMKAVFGFPNRASYPGFMRSLLWHRITALRHYYYRIGYRRIWGAGIDRIYKFFHKMILTKKTAGLRYRAGESRIETTAHLPDEIEGLCAELLNYEVLSIWKDLKYLRWRYENHPDNRYTFHILWVADRPECLIVTMEKGRDIAICDLLSRTKNIRQAASLLAYVIRLYQATSAQVIHFFGYDDGFFDSVFILCGFSAEYSGDYVFGGRVFGDGDLANKYVIPQNWTIAYGDTDFL